MFAHSELIVLTMHVFSLDMCKIDKINVFGKFDICYFMCSCLILILDDLDSCCRQS